jgi:hypothetical protein
MLKFELQYWTVICNVLLQNRVETFKIETFKVATFWVETFGVETFGVETFRVETFRVETFRVINFRDATLLRIKSRIRCYLAFFKNIFKALLFSEISLIIKLKFHTKNCTFY